MPEDSGQIEIITKVADRSVDETVA